MPSASNSTYKTSNSTHKTETRNAIKALQLTVADDPAVRAVTAIGLLAVGIIHALEIPGQLGGAAWLTLGFIGLAPPATPRKN